MEARSMTPALHVVAADETPPAAKVETVSERVRRLTAEAKALAREDVQAFEAEITALIARAATIEDGGDAYAPGARQLARSVRGDLTNRGQTLAAILGRAS